MKKVYNEIIYKIFDIYSDKNLANMHFNRLFAEYFSDFCFELQEISFEFFERNNLNDKGT